MHQAIRQAVQFAMTGIAHNDTVGFYALVLAHSSPSQARCCACTTVTYKILQGNRITILTVLSNEVCISGWGRVGVAWGRVGRVG